MIYLDKPEDFKHVIEASGCYIEYKGKFLMFQRPETKTHPKTWQLPGGKHEINETPLDAMKREVREETGIELSNKALFLHKFYVRYPEHDFIYNVFKIELSEEPEIIMSREHDGYQWVTPEESLSLPLVPDQDQVIRLVYKV